MTGSGRRGRPNTIGAELGAAMAADYNAGLTVRQVTAKYQLGYGTVYYALGLAGVQMRRAGGKRKQVGPLHPARNGETRQRLAKQYNAGASIEALAAHSGYSYHVVRRALLQEGVEIRRVPVRLSRSDPALAKGMARAYTGDADRPGLNVRAVAAAFGKSYGVTYRALIDAGVTFRRKNRNNGGRRGAFP